MKIYIIPLFNKPQISIMEKNLQNTEATEKFKELAKEVNICMFVTSTPGGDNSTRPMATIQVDDDASVWFFTNKQSEKIRLIATYTDVQLIYSHPGKDSYMDVRGNAAIIEDRKTIKDLWNPIVKVWFPEGTDDPNLCLVKVSPDTVFYWSNTNSSMVEGFKMVASLVTGKKLDQGDEGMLEV